MAIKAFDEVWIMSAEYDVAKAIYTSRRKPTFSEICEMFDNAELYPLLTKNQVSAALDTLIDCGIVKSQWGKGKRKKARIHIIDRNSRETLRTLIDFWKNINLKKEKAIPPKTEVLGVLAEQL